MVHIEGRQQLVHHIAGFRDLIPGATMERRSRVDGYGQVLRFAWAVVGADDSVVVEGIDFIKLNPEGQIHSVTGFFGALD